MPLPNSAGAYIDCYSVFDRAVADSRGARVAFDTFSEARHFQLRMNYARTLQRRDNSEIYDRGHPLWGTSVYDSLMVKTPIEDTGNPSHWWVYIEHRGLNVVAIETLSDL